MAEPFLTGSSAPGAYPDSLTTPVKDEAWPSAPACLMKDDVMKMRSPRDRLAAKSIGRAVARSSFRAGRVLDRVPVVLMKRSRMGMNSACSEAGHGPRTRIGAAFARGRGTNQQTP